MEQKNENAGNAGYSRSSENIDADDGIDLPRLAVTLSNALVTLSGEQCRGLQGPIVYALFRQGVPWYVGMSACGLARPLVKKHDYIVGFTPTDSLYIWQFGSIKDASAKEQELVALWHPHVNRAIPTPIHGTCAYCGEDLNYSSTRGSAKRFCSAKCRTRAYRTKKEERCNEKTNA